jgi:hypothetical protein
LSKASAKTITGAYATNDAGASSVTDYEPVSGTLTFDPGQTSKAVDVKTRPDAIDENTERFDLRLSNATNATIADSRGIGSITDDDGSPSLRVGDVRLAEGTGTLSQFAIPVTISAIAGRNVTVKFATRDRTAHAGLDYSGVSGTATIPAGQAMTTILVPVFGDAIDEPSRQFEVRLSSASGASIADSTGVETIVDDDVSNTAPRLTYLKFFPRVIHRHRVGTLRLILSERARVAVTAQRLVPRRRARLAHWVTVRRIVVVRGPGAGKVRFLTRSLPAGRYRFLARARDRQGLVSAQRRTAFRIIR